MKTYLIIALTLLMSPAISQTEHAVRVSGITDLELGGIGIGYVNILHDHMGGKKLRSFYIDVEMGLGRGLGVAPRVGWAFSPVMNKKTFQTKNKVRTNFFEVSISPAVYFKDSLGITCRPEIAYLFNTPFEALKSRISYGYDFGIFNREFTAPRRNIFSVSLIWYFSITGMFI